MVQSLLEEVDSRMKAAGARRVKSIQVNVGKSSAYSKESLRQAYVVLTENTELGKARLVLKSIDGVEVILQRLVMEE